MKKQYITPTVEIHQLTSQEVLSSTSGVQSSKGIGYGGVDTGGSLVPDAKQRGTRGSADDFDELW